MQRRHFLAAAASVTASAAAVTALAETPSPYVTPLPGYSPMPRSSSLPGGHVRHLYRGTGGHETSLAHVHRTLERLIDMLERYQAGGQSQSQGATEQQAGRGYTPPQSFGVQSGSGSHISQAIGYLQQADTEVVSALDTATPAPTL